MSNNIALNKIIKKAKKIILEKKAINEDFVKNSKNIVNENDTIEATNSNDNVHLNINDEIILKIYNISEERTDLERELSFLTMYYGLGTEALTLEGIGQAQKNILTRERVRQIIDSSLLVMKKENNNIYDKTEVLFTDLIKKQEGNFIRYDTLVEDSAFSGFKKNVKGLIAFLNDCNIRQIAYRKNYYFYHKEKTRKDITVEIQEKNKLLRREKTVAKMDEKAKTVTYTPHYVRRHLLEYSNNKEVNLNTLYEQILLKFIEKKPYEHPSYNFPKTKSWKARKGKAQWEQIGIYIDKDIFSKVKDIVKQIKKDKKGVSLMNFICQSFVWHYDNNNK